MPGTFLLSQSFPQYSISLPSCTVKNNTLVLNKASSLLNLEFWRHLRCDFYMKFRISRVGRWCLWVPGVTLGHPCLATGSWQPFRSLGWQDNKLPVALSVPPSPRFVVALAGELWKQPARYLIPELPSAGVFSWQRNKAWGISGQEILYGGFISS